MLNVPQYTVSEKVWEGHNSTIYRSRRDSDGAQVMFKTSKSEYPGAREVARIQQEYNLLKSIDDKHVVKPITLQRVQHGIVLIMEDFGGQSLSALLAAGKLDFGTKLTIALSIAESLVALRREHVLHKDIKPANIAFNLATGETKLIDFGLATRLDREVQRFVRPDALEGTLAYISPEQTGRMNRDIDHRSDLYSTGITLYELFTGELPFRTRDALEMVHSHIARVPVAPHERVPSIPEQLSRIVMKLITKEPEQRYQTAQGLVADLALCVKQWRETGQIELFKLAQHEANDALRIPQKLYGREKEIQTLLAAFEEVRRNRTALALVTGAAGVGKSALIHEVYRLVALHGGEFISGKCDQIHRGLPFALFAQAARELVRQLLTESPEKLEEWKQKLLAVLGSSGQVLIDVLPELERVIGPQPSVPSLTPTEAQNRFGLIFQKFIEIFCRPGRPLVMFADDLQWADSGSLWLLQYLESTLKDVPFLVVGAYRDHEVDEAHPLRSMLAELRKEGVEPVEIRVGNIDQASVRELLRDALPGAEREPLDALAEQMFVKTQGSPLFLTQLLLEWYKDGLIHVDQATGRWSWDAAEVAKAPVPDNVADFLANKLKTLPSNAQGLVSLAACIGHQFDLTTLSTIAGRSEAEVASALWPVLQSGLLTPLDSDYRLVLGPSVSDAPEREAATDIQVAYRFLHDRVQQAAYSLIDAREKHEVHLRIGRRLRGRLTDPPEAAALFEVVNHMNAGAASITDPAERLELARLNLSAGEAAKSATAFGAAVSLFEAGVAMLDQTSWSEHYDLSFRLHRELAECLYMAREPDRADAEIELLFRHTKETRERASLYGLKTQMYMALSRAVDALEAGRQGLLLFDIVLPETMDQIMATFMGELAFIDGWLAEHSLESLLDKPMTGANEQVIIQLLSTMIYPAFWVNPPLFAVLTAKQVSITLAHGIAGPSSSGFSEFGMSLNGLTGRSADAIRMGEMGLKIGEKLGALTYLSQTHNLFGMFSPCGKPYQVGAAHSQAAIDIGVETGNFLCASNSAYQKAALVYATGEPLDRVQEEVDRGFAVLQWSREKTTPGALWFLRQAVACLQGKTKGHLSMDDDTFSEAERVAYERSIDNKTILFVHSLTRLELAAWYGEPESFLEPAMMCEQIAMGGLGTLNMPFTLGYGALVLTARHASAPPDEQQRIMEVLGRIRPRFDAFAAGCPENYRPFQLLLGAELARIEGDHAKASDLYDEAAVAAQASGLIQYVALANELCGRMHVSLKRPKIARAYLADARVAYQNWGAAGKVRHLEEKYPELLSAPAVRTTAGSTGDTHTTSVSTTSTKSLSLDVPTIIKASQALSGEISFDKLMLRMMSVVAENAGAEKGALILPTDDELRIVAEVSAQAGVTIQQNPIPLDGHQGIAHGIVRYVNRTHESVVIDDASTGGPFMKDPDIVSRKPRSILCMPLLHQGRLKGVLYLENNLTAGTFTVERTMLLSALCSQMAISVENAHVYANLEALVEERTRELREAQARLVKLEKQATEVRMAGGFAHEMRNALASAQMRLDVVYNPESKPDVSVVNETGDALKELFLLSKENMAAETFQRSVPLFQKAYSLQKKLASSLSGIAVDIARALNVTGRILDYSRQGFESRVSLPVDMNKLVDGIARGVGQTVSADHPIEFRVHVDESCVLLGNESHFFSIINNLVLNSRDAVLDLTDGRERKIDVIVKQAQGGALIEVSDSGVGIAADHLPKIFEPFYSTKPNSGTGLGLSMVERLVSNYGGTIDVKSDPAVGTTVRVLIPSMAS